MLFEVIQRSSHFHSLEMCLKHRDMAQKYSSIILKFAVSSAIFVCFEISIILHSMTAL